MKTIIKEGKDLKPIKVTFKMNNTHDTYGGVPYLYLACRYKNKVFDMTIHPLQGDLSAEYRFSIPNNQIIFSISDLSNMDSIQKLISIFIIQALEEMKIHDVKTSMIQRSIILS